MDLMFNVHPVTKDTPLPEASLVSSVAIIAINKGSNTVEMIEFTGEKFVPHKIEFSSQKISTISCLSH